jgi:hypothetical protein
MFIVHELRIRSKIPVKRYSEHGGEFDFRGEKHYCANEFCGSVALTRSSVRY